MNSDPKEWQEQVQRIFDFVRELYAQMYAVFEDADRAFSAQQCPIAKGGRIGGSCFTTDLSNGGYVYFKAVGAIPVEHSSDESEPSIIDIALFCVHLHPEPKVAVGPQIYFGSARVPANFTKLDHWSLLSATGGSPQVIFDIDGENPLTATPNGKGMKELPGIERVKLWRLPLSRLTSAAELEAVVIACTASARGDEGPAMKLLTRNK